MFNPKHKTLSFLFFQLLKTLPPLQKQIDALLEFDVSILVYSILKMNLACL